MSEGSSSSISLLTLLTFQVLVCLLVLILATQVGVKSYPVLFGHLLYREMSIQVLYPFKELGCLFVAV